MTIPSYVAAIKGLLIAHTFEDFPAEACGIIVEGQYMPCKNIHPTPVKNFAISAEDYARAESMGEIQAIFHSHPNDYNQFSPHDAKACRSSNVPWLMYCAATDDWHYADPTGNAPYEGRQWHYGIHDCYSLLKDFYKNEFCIELDDYDRGEEMEWESPDWNMFERNFQSQGFAPCEAPFQKGDMLLMQLQSPTPNHVGVMAIPEQNIFYQHLLDRLSEASIYGGYWAKVTSKVLRHKALR
jgi:proteasome lid subunit RPN8/RPN11